MATASNDIRCRCGPPQLNVRPPWNIGAVQTRQWTLVYISKLEEIHQQILHLSGNEQTALLKSNREAKGIVRAAKDALKKAQETYLASLVYRTTPGPCGHSPAQQSIGRTMYNTATLPSQLILKMPNHVDFRRDKRNGGTLEGKISSMG